MSGQEIFSLSKDQDALSSWPYDVLLKWDAVKRAPHAPSFEDRESPGGGADKNLDFFRASKVAGNNF